jgi:iron complex outermembrane receptor protein
MRAAGNDVTGFIRSLTLAVLLALLWSLQTAAAADDESSSERIAFDIPRQRADLALVEFAAQADVTFIFPFEEARRKTANRLKGTYTRDQAIELLLKSTGLHARFDEHGALAVHSTKKSETDGDGMTNTTTKGLAGIAATIMGLFTSQGARAQDGAGESGTSPALEKLEEIVVTATKRAESIQDVPLSIAAITSEDIDRRGLIGMEDYLRSVPGVNQVDTGGRDNTIVIRGISTSLELQNANNNVTVATYFDETPITGAAGNGSGNIDLRPVDVERIEVLRGPQGTTFGSAALGGAMRLIPAKPVLDNFMAKGSGAYSLTGGEGGDNSMMQGVVNIPLVADQLAVRAVAYRYDDSGYYKNTAGLNPATVAAATNAGLGDLVNGFVQDDIGRMITNGGRVAALWQATDKLSVSANVLRQVIEQDGRPVSTTGEFEQSRIRLSPENQSRGEPGEIADTDMDLANLVVNYDLGWAGLTSAASWVDSGSDWTQAYDHSNITLPSSKATSEFKSFTGEVRLASKLDGRFQFLGGLYYESIDQTYHQSYYWPGDPARNPHRINPQVDTLSDGSGDLDQRAVFGEVSYDLTDHLTATVGGRYFSFEKVAAGIAEGLGVGIPIGTGQWVSTQIEDEDSTFKAGLTYKPNSTAMVYANWAQGYRLGPPDPSEASRRTLVAFCDRSPADGIIDETNVAVSSVGHIDSDFLDNYEIGGKFSLFDRRLLIDAAVYHIEWDGLPFRIRPTQDCVYTANAGSATSDGVEFHASLALVQGLRLDLGAGYTDAQLTSDVPEQGFRDGDRLPGSPKVNANLGAQYDFGIGTHEAFVRFDSLYTGEFYGDLSSSPGTRSGDYVKLDARAGVKIRQLSVELFIKNLTDEDAYTWRGQAGAASGIRTPDFGYRLRPRTIGVQLGYSFE